MKQLVFLFLAAGLLTGCEKDVPVGDVLQAFTVSPRTLEADGQSTAEVSVKLPPETSADRRNVVFTAGKGLFSPAGTAKYTAKAEFINGELIAKATLRMPLQPGSVEVTAQLEYDSPVQEYALKDVIEATPSVPASLVIEPNRFGLGTNFTGEVRLVGTLRNTQRRNVSTGNRVLFEDFLPSGTRANGRFRNNQLQSNDTSRVSTVYAASAYPLGTTIKVRGTVLDANGLKTRVADSVLLTVNF
ncbi:hypothetical protein [Hymenobacter perfusus]|uniref:Uncharacterized protein n=1 Tax=Hymenobacter perfusus TaxID=1236770 RepID=A0A428JXX8_9BACT|nr:hypothetical protein [Hymenobacter perfusus]RSK38993.1 hypothetical protein EI293_20950 [Hymenobacter perfusus]